MATDEGGTEERHLAFYRALVETSHDIHTVTDRLGNFLYQSPAIERVLGYAPEELVGDNGFSYIHPDDLPALFRAYDQILEAPGASAQVRVRMRHKAGNWVYLDILGRNQIDNSELGGLFLASRDVTEREIDRQILLRREQHLRTVVSHQNMILWAIDVDGTITMSEGEGLRAMGLESGQLVGESVFELYAHDEGALSHLRRALAGNWMEYVYEVETPNGPIVLESLLSPQFDADGQVTAVTALSIDISERARLEQELRRARTLEAIGLLAGGIAHDFNNLLTAMVGFATAAKRAEGDEVDGHLDHVLLSADRGAALVKQLLAFARKDEVHPEVVDANELLGDMRPVLEEIAGEAVRIELAVDGDGPWTIKVDRSKFEQVLVNLTTNARDAISNSGVVKFVFRRLEPETDSGPERICLEVVDNGEGIDAGVLEHVFDPFYSTRREGSGLGLATARSVVMRSGGSIDVESSRGLGSCFRLVFPACGETTTERAQSQGDRAAVDGATILLIDDNIAVLDATAIMLEMAGYEVRKASSGQEGYETFVLERAAIDLIMTDLTMPGMKGDELIRRIRDFDKHTPILCVSGFHEGSAGLETLPNVHLLTKPYLGDEPMATLAKLLSRRALA